MRRAADYRGGQHQPAEFAVLRRGRELRAADGLDARREGQAYGVVAGEPGTVAGNGGAFGGGRERTGLLESSAERQYSSGMFSRLIFIFKRIERPPITTVRRRSTPEDASLMTSYFISFYIYVLYT